MQVKITSEEKQRRKEIIDLVRASSALEELKPSSITADIEDRYISGELRTIGDYTLAMRKAVAPMVSRAIKEIKLDFSILSDQSGKIFINIYPADFGGYCEEENVLLNIDTGLRDGQPETISQVGAINLVAMNIIESTNTYTMTTKAEAVDALRETIINPKPHLDQRDVCSDVAKSILSASEAWIDIQSDLPVG